MGQEHTTKMKISELADREKDLTLKVKRPSLWTKEMEVIKKERVSLVDALCQLKVENHAAEVTLYHSKVREQELQKEISDAQDLMRKLSSQLSTVAKYKKQVETDSTVATDSLAEMQPDGEVHDIRDHESRSRRPSLFSGEAKVLVEEEDVVDKRLKVPPPQPEISLRAQQTNRSEAERAAFRSFRRFTSLLVGQGIPPT